MSEQHPTPVVRDWRALQGALDGELVLPESAGYESARKPFFARFHGSRPQAVVMCSGAADVVETLRFARKSGVPTVTRAGGHCFAGRSSGSGMVIDLSPMRSVRLSGGLATTGAGIRLGELYDALAIEGVTIPAGTCPSVGIAGLTLGGGLGTLGRMFGLTSDHLESAEVVLANGQVLECDAYRSPDLFWALRGGGAGSFGVVTRLQFRTRPALPATNFRITWAAGDCGSLVRAWQQWAPHAPDEFYAALVISAAGDVGEAGVELVGSAFGSEDDARTRLDEFLESCGAEPVSEFLEHMSFRDTCRFWAEPDTTNQIEGDGPEQELERAHVYFKSEFFRRPVPDSALTALLGNFSRDRAPREDRELEFAPWGGAYNRIAADATAFAHRAELFSLKHMVAIDSSRSSAAKKSANEWVERSWSSVHPSGSGRVFPNFPDPTLKDPGRAYYATNYERLLRVKRRYDPDGFFPPVA